MTAFRGNIVDHDQLRRPLGPRFFPVSYMPFVLRRRYDSRGEFVTDNTNFPSVFRFSKSSWACEA